MPSDPLRAVSVSMRTIAWCAQDLFLLRGNMLAPASIHVAAHEPCQPAAAKCSCAFGTFVSLIGLQSAVISLIDRRSCALADCKGTSTSHSVFRA
jgi:hypothetical protein